MTKQQGTATGRGRGAPREEDDLPRVMSWKVSMHLMFENDPKSVRHAGIRCLCVQAYISTLGCSCVESLASFCQVVSIAFPVLAVDCALLAALCKDWPLHCQLLHH